MPRKRGGGILESVLSTITPSVSLHHPYLAGNSPNYVQTLSHQWNGSLDPVPHSGNPVDFSWQFKTSPQLRIAADPSSVVVSATPTGPSATVTGPSTRGGRRTYRKKYRFRTRRSHRKATRKPRRR